MSKTMRAIEITEFGGPEVLKLTERPVPIAGKGEVLINVSAAGINRPDTLQRKGGYPPPPGASDIPGLEIAGHIVALGEGVKGLKEGDEVVALLTGGGYADYAVAHQSCVLPLPKGLSMADGASLPETYFTVWSNVMDRGGLKKGENFLVHGGTSGIGVAAIQLAHAFGGKVFSTSGDTKKVQKCLELGATYAINYKEQDFVEEVMKATNGEGVDLILDMVAGSYINHNISMLKKDGRLVFIAFLGGTTATVDFTQVLLKRLTITGSTLRPQPNPFKGKIRDALLKKVWPLLEDGTIYPVVDTIYPLAKAANAHKRMEDGKHIGKIILDCDG